MINYPTFEELNTEPDYLYINIQETLRRAGYLKRKISKPHVPAACISQTKPRKPYQSQYIGVSRRYNGYCGHWAPEPGKYVRGPVRGSEKEAAQDRAAALGLDYLEVRG